ncbi:7-cyano-7-deazaguanine synthase [Tenacibaculum discolor]|uniref:7-cyano-7-deazaguanine synthase n=1 Tax=Tenacibaculum discolor TaxID=361581 RepID=A0A2G1BVH8_9FLAO|nr:7-cyano-7-deazaguanine synthase [Tenacibaculum discolor]MDP2540051.1 7-cyano-7-deazaguanine synthase [Tenacibaculum discolor]PHN98008.1 7-cyano-7-deazaguanine synthase [Tenacibaculum discolor]PHO01981.1 7-cyano-7-deazaguanine synthase [Rhodobacteraceae bacterium 4F10]
MANVKKAVLLSGGIDSICLTYGIMPDIAYTIDYGQTVSKRELYVSKYICEKLDIEHKIIKIDCRSLGSGTLANSENLKLSPSDEWWPFRNQLLITFAAMQAIKDEVKELYLSSVKSDGFHRDGTKEFYKLINNLVSYQEGQIKVICPTLDYYSHELALKYKVPINLLSIAHSCHISNFACGKCSGCIKQLKVRYELKIA